MPGTNRDLLFWSRSRCFTWKKHRWGLGPTETCNFSPIAAVLHGKTTGGVWDPQRIVILALKSLFCMHKTTGEGWNPYSLDTLVLSTLLCVLKTTDEVWDPYRLISLAQKSLFCMHKTTEMRAGTHIDLSI